ncbi:uncharacterized protein V6R79_013552 [Siganus canaliculatus]
MAKAALCLCLYLMLCQVRGFYVSKEMSKSIQSLLQHYNISDTDRFNGEPIFSREPLPGKLETKKVFLGGVLLTYEKMIDRMLEQLPTPSPQSSGNDDPHAEVRKQLKKVQTKIRNLKEYRYGDEEKILERLESLRDIKMDDLMVQSKALGELPFFYEEASSLSDHSEKQRRRRRRQAKRARFHLKG